MEPEQETRTAVKVGEKKTKKMFVLATVAMLGGQASLADSYIFQEHFNAPNGTSLTNLNSYTYSGGPNIEGIVTNLAGISVSNAPEAAIYRFDIPDFSLATLGAGQELVFQLKAEVLIGGGGAIAFGGTDSDGDAFNMGISPGVPRWDIYANAGNVDLNPSFSGGPNDGDFVEMQHLISENQSRFRWRKLPNGSWTDIGAGTYAWGGAGPTVFETIFLRLAGNYNNATFDDWEVYVYPAPVQTASVALVQEEFSGSGDLALNGGYSFLSGDPGGGEADIVQSGGTGSRIGAAPETGEYVTNIPCFFSLASLVGTQALSMSIEHKIQSGGSGFLQVGGTDTDGDKFYVGFSPGVPRFDIGANWNDVDLNPGFPGGVPNGEFIEMRMLITSNSSTFQWRQITPAVGAWTAIGAGTYAWGSPTEAPTVFKDLYIRVADDYGALRPFDNWKVSVFPAATKGSLMWLK